MSTGSIVRVELKGAPDLQAKIRVARTILTDLRPLWELLISDFYKSEKEIFGLKGKSSRFQDLTPAYKKQKRRIYGFVYPILVASGTLANSLLTRGAYGSIAAASPMHLTLGTRISWAIYHHNTDPRTKMPRRPVFDDNPQGAMLKRWTRTADAYVRKAIKGAFSGTSGSGIPGSGNV